MSTDLTALEITLLILISCAGGAMGSLIGLCLLRLFEDRS